MAHESLVPYIYGLLMLAELFIVPIFHVGSKHNNKSVESQIYGKSSIERKK